MRIKAIQHATIFTLSLCMHTFIAAQGNTTKDSTISDKPAIDILVLNQGIIGLSKMEAEIIGEYIKDEINETFIFKSISNEDLENQKYEECFDEKCLKGLSEALNIKNFLFWSLEKSGTKYSGNFTRHVFVDDENTKSKVKSVKMNLKTENVDEMILAMRMNTWKALELKPPKGKFDNIAGNTMYRSNRLRGLLAVLAIIIGYGIFSEDGPSGPEPFENPPDWPNV